MSNIYIQEPPTKGKVLLKTTVGDIEIELWSRECPKTCRNFVQLCMENYYNKTKFHRVVKDFIVQGGDPTGTGRGGESIYGHPFKDEFHSRLRFVRRGLVAMANAGKDDNGSQFFFTFGPAQELQNKHTIFGKVVGDTIYNMLKLQDGVIIDEKPETPHKILKTEVLNNPFPDIKPREVIKMIKDEKKEKKPKSKMRATKDFSLLSFGDEAEEEEVTLKEVSKEFSSRGKSSHDLLSDPSLLSEVPDELKKKGNNANEDMDDEVASGDVQVNSENSKSDKALDIDVLKQKLKRKQEPETKASKEISRKPAELYGDEDEDEEAKEKRRRREDIQKQIKQLKREMKKNKNDEEENSKSDEDSKNNELTEEERNNELLRAFHEERKKYAQKKPEKAKKGSAREEATMRLLEKFTNKLHSVKEKEEEGDKKAEKLEKMDSGEDEEDVTGDDWMRHSLKFESNDPILAKDASTKDDDWFDIYDPRNPVNKRRRGEKTRSKK